MPHKISYMISEVVFEIGPVCPACLTTDILEEVVLLISKASILEEVRIHSDTVTLCDLLHTKTWLRISLTWRDYSLSQEMHHNAYSSCYGVLLPRMLFCFHFSLIGLPMLFKSFAYKNASDWLVLNCHSKYYFALIMQSI